MSNHVSTSMLLCCHCHSDLGGGTAVICVSCHSKRCPGCALIVLGSQGVGNSEYGPCTGCCPFTGTPCSEQNVIVVDLSAQNSAGTGTYLSVLGALANGDLDLAMRQLNSQIKLLTMSMAAVGPALAAALRGNAEAKKGIVASLQDKINALGKAKKIFFK